jgi:hypothetical protein
VHDYIEEKREALEKWAKCLKDLMLAGVPHFPFALMLGMSLGLGVTLCVYYALPRRLAR